MAKSSLQAALNILQKKILLQEMAVVGLRMVLQKSSEQQCRIMEKNMYFL
jgi:hypothetical protein